MKTMQELDLSKSYNGTVVEINRRDKNGDWESIIPDHSPRLEIGDKLVLMGKACDLKRIKKEFDKNS
jgi:Trk K+ transport system NAD-binding subunit